MPAWFFECRTRSKRSDEYVVELGHASCLESGTEIAGDSVGGGDGPAYEEAGDHGRLTGTKSSIQSRAGNRFRADPNYLSRSSKCAAGGIEFCGQRSPVRSSSAPVLECGTPPNHNGSAERSLVGSDTTLCAKLWVDYPQKRDVLRGIDVAVRS